ncbi:hypothetical protein ACU4GA_24810 [Methylobacterium oryzae CBMB20]
MREPEPTFETLRDAHVAALTGSLIDGLEHGPGAPPATSGRAASRTRP